MVDIEALTRSAAARLDDAGGEFNGQFLHYLLQVFAGHARPMRYLPRDDDEVQPTQIDPTQATPVDPPMAQPVPGLDG